MHKTDFTHRLNFAEQRLARFAVTPEDSNNVDTNINEILGAAEAELVAENTDPANHPVAERIEENIEGQKHSFWFNLKKFLDKDARQASFELDNQLNQVESTTFRKLRGILPQLFDKDDYFRLHNKLDQLRKRRAVYEERRESYSNAASAMSEPGRLANEYELLDEKTTNKVRGMENDNDQLTKIAAWDKELRQLLVYSNPDYFIHQVEINDLIVAAVGGKPQALISAINDNLSGDDNKNRKAKALRLVNLVNVKAEKRPSRLRGLIQGIGSAFTKEMNQAWQDHCVMVKEYKTRNQALLMNYYRQVRETSRQVGKTVPERINKLKQSPIGTSIIGLEEGAEAEEFIKIRELRLGANNTEYLIFRNSQGHLACIAPNYDPPQITIRRNGTDTTYDLRMPTGDHEDAKYVPLAIGDERQPDPAGVDDQESIEDDESTGAETVELIAHTAHEAIQNMVIIYNETGAYTGSVEVNGVKGIVVAVQTVETSNGVTRVILDGTGEHTNIQIVVDYDDDRILDVTMTINEKTCQAPGTVKLIEGELVFTLNEKPEPAAGANDSTDGQKDRSQSPERTTSKDKNKANKKLKKKNKKLKMRVAKAKSQKESQSEMLKIIGELANKNNVHIESVKVKKGGAMGVQNDAKVEGNYEETIGKESKKSRKLRKGTLRILKELRAGQEVVIDEIKELREGVAEGEKKIGLIKRQISTGFSAAKKDRATKQEQMSEVITDGFEDMEDQLEIGFTTTLDRIDNLRQALTRQKNSVTKAIEGIASQIEEVKEGQNTITQETKKQIQSLRRLINTAKKELGEVSQVIKDLEESQSKTTEDITKLKKKDPFRRKVFTDLVKDFAALGEKLDGIFDEINNPTE